MSLAKPSTITKNQETTLCENLSGSNLFNQLDDNSKDITLNLAKYLKYKQDSKDSKYNNK